VTGGGCGVLDGWELLEVVGGGWLEVADFLGVAGWVELAGGGGGWSDGWGWLEMA